jgi:hypothetical protein
MNKKAPKPKNWIRYYDDRNITDEITNESVDLILDEHLRDEILSGQRKRKLKNVTIKIDPLQRQGSCKEMKLRSCEVKKVRRLEVRGPRAEEG